MPERLALALGDRLLADRTCADGCGIDGLLGLVVDLLLLGAGAVGAYVLLAVAGFGLVLGGGLAQAFAGRTVVLHMVALTALFAGTACLAASAAWLLVEVPGR